MKFRTFSVLVVWVAAVWTVSVATQAAEVLPGPTEGLPLVELILRVPGAGYRSDPPGRSGTAALLRAVLDEDALGRKFEQLGAVRSSDLDADGMIFRVQGFSSDREELVSLLWAWVFSGQSLGAASSIAASQGLLAERYSHLSDDPEGWAMSALNTLVWRGTSSERGVIQSVAELKQITAADLKNFHAQNVRSQGAKLWVIGEGAIVDAVRSQVQTLELSQPAAFVRPLAPAPRLATRPSKVPVQQQPLFLKRKSMGPALVYWGSRFARPTAGEVAAFWVANSLLGEGSTSRLVRRVRDAGGIAYAVQSGFQFQSDGWVWLVSAAAPAATVQNLVKRLTAAVAELRKGPIDAEEFRIAREAALGRLKLLKANSRAWVYRGMDVPETDSLLTEIPRVRVEDVLRALNRAWAEPNPQIVIVGDVAPH